MAAHTAQVEALAGKRIWGASRHGLSTSAPVMALSSSAGSPKRLSAAFVADDFDDGGSSQEARADADMLGRDTA